ncbi:hypothetical protein SARC_05085 [Sphaeroforma arctica JP610]|uniref:Uncharacterized protein n=1 Tax=Sphaeroforma arctica JP610 TaxID=667725 RepID=A0A0L0G1D6_9EUKA|nr:hypothetical protein SARC_05085 [Sphaeroforma arctica JP610]KNC82629.1 hypothetical protein SARC_05085 [Sphaeroforma arctica JP610]|eukprot:XP_014156531.1 hypothetical protein SARC_05085 [Sphaeroforma arctica JP610]
MTAVEAIRVAFALAQVYHITNANQAIDMPAYTVIANASVYTVDSTNLWVNAFAYDTSGVIIAVGTDEEVSTRVQEMATVDGGDVVTIDAEGKYIMPGFQDTHVHVIEGGLSELGVYCLMEPDQSTEQYIAALLECSENQTGVTSVSDAGVYWTRGHVEAWRRAEAEGMLTARASNALYLFPDREYTSQVLFDYVG